MKEFTLYRSSTQSILKLNCWDVFKRNTVDIDTIEKYVEREFPTWLLKVGV